MKIALITGITGQDGTFLTSLLLSKDYIVHGIIRRSAVKNSRIIKLENMKNVVLHYGDITDSLSIINIIKEVKPQEIYNLAGQSDVNISFNNPIYTTEVNAIGILNILEAVKILELNCKIYQASTSEMFGDTKVIPQDETTIFNPCSPYGCAKLYAHNICMLYKNAYNMFISCGILFNHESEERGLEFVSRKITNSVAKIKLNKQEKLSLGNINSKRDWGYAKDYVEAMWKILQLKKPDNFVIATYQQHTVKDFCELAFKEIGIDIVWKGTGINEKGYDKKTNKLLIDIDEKYFRPLDVKNLLGNPQKAMKDLNFNPNNTSLKELVHIMVEHDLKKVEKGYE